ncbi:nucleoside deaminase [Porphyromonas miyakawae]|uniref:tRNA-specific adenosine deaminase n=1 Tax=Porphyromonas miyakawae TaxID=3137470 RepID=A0ABQ0E3T4_9PORP
MTPSFSSLDERFMRRALEEAQLAFDEGEIPIGAVITDGKSVIASAHNMVERLCDISAHAEMIALSAASLHFRSKYLPQCTLYVTIEPCAMCMGALRWSQIGRIVFGAEDTKAGYKRFQTGIEHPKAIVESGLLADEAAALMRGFFAVRRR